jgi:hypothetical protein
MQGPKEPYTRPAPDTIPTFLVRCHFQVMNSLATAAAAEYVGCRLNLAEAPKGRPGACIRR